MTSSSLWAVIQNRSTETNWKERKRINFLGWTNSLIQPLTLSRLLPQSGGIPRELHNLPLFLSLSLSLSLTWCTWCVSHSLSLSQLNQLMLVSFSCRGEESHHYTSYLQSIWFNPSICLALSILIKVRTDDRYILCCTSYVQSILPSSHPSIHM